MSYEGGFQGRTNKLVDGCYSFWVGATIPIIQAIISSKGKPIAKSLFDIGALQEYVLLCCQKSNGGLIDKPGKYVRWLWPKKYSKLGYIFLRHPDLYHTCYTLTGVAIAQHSQSTQNPLVLADPVNELLPAHPLFNVPPETVAQAIYFFEKLNKPQVFTAFDTESCTHWKLIVNY